MRRTTGMLPAATRDDFWAVLVPFLTRLFVPGVPGGASLAVTSIWLLGGCKFLPVALHLSGTDEHHGALRY